MEKSSAAKIKWREQSAIHFYHVEHESFNWRELLEEESVFSEALRYVHSDSELSESSGYEADVWPLD